MIDISYFERDTKSVARSLIGKKLVHHVGKMRLSGVIVETEAYLGTRDPACHSFGGKKTARNAVMFESAGTIYVYLIYGMYHCLNFVTCKEGIPEAVLIRAIEPLEGIDEMMRRRDVKDLRKLASGPGKLCQALGITREHNGLLLGKGSLTVEEGEIISPRLIDKSPRIGIGYAGEAAHWPLRFSLRGSRYVSR